jgi:hypothetical protein
MTATEPFLATGMLAELFPSNSCLFWLHNSGFEQMCHNMKRKKLVCLGKVKIFHEVEQNLNVLAIGNLTLHHNLCAS